MAMTGFFERLRRWSAALSMIAAAATAFATLSPALGEERDNAREAVTNLEAYAEYKMGTTTSLAKSGKSSPPRATRRR